jgi:hypothetical protein
VVAVDQFVALKVEDQYSVVVKLEVGDHKKPALVADQWDTTAWEITVDNVVVKAALVAVAYRSHGDETMQDYWKTTM